MHMENVLAFPGMAESRERIDYVITLSTGKGGKKYNIIGLKTDDREELDRIAALLESMAMDLRGPNYR